jgi:hypothetical protein
MFSVFSSMSWALPMRLGKSDHPTYSKAKLGKQNPSPRVLAQFVCLAAYARPTTPLLVAAFQGKKPLPGQASQRLNRSRSFCLRVWRWINGSKGKASVLLSLRMTCNVHTRGRFTYT